MELCGGTHVETTAEIGSFRVINETSSAAGVRRIEVVTGRGAEALIEQRLAALQDAADLLHVRPEEIVTAAQQLADSHRELQRQVEQTTRQLAQQAVGSLVDSAIQIDGFAVLAARVDAADVDTMREMTDSFRNKLGSSVVVLGSVVNDKPILVAGVTQDLIERGLHAGNLVRDAAKIIGGGGGGRPNMANAGGRDVDKLPEALESVASWVERQLQ